MNKEFTKEESKILKGIAILFMVGLHLYNRVDIDGYYEPILKLGEYPLIYYVSFLFDSCVPIYCFSSGYAIYIMKDKPFKYRLNRLFGLLKNYWIVLVLTCITGIIFSNEYIPGNIFTVLGNVSLIRINYVGAWWFIQTYVLLTLSSKWMIQLVDKYNGYLISFISIIMYFVAYYFRMINPILFDNVVIDSIINAFVLFGTSQFPYFIGILFKKYNVISKLRTIFKYLIIGYALVLLCVIGHIIVKSMIVAPFVAIVFIFGYSLIPVKGATKKILLFFADHSTNIWLTHMQFYSLFFSDLVFITNTVLGCFIILMIMCVCSSYFIKSILNSIDKRLRFIS